MGKKLIETKKNINKKAKKSTRNIAKKAKIMAKNIIKVIKKRSMKAKSKCKLCKTAKCSSNKAGCFSMLGIFLCCGEDQNQSRYSPPGLEMLEMPRIPRQLGPSEI